MKHFVPYILKAFCWILALFGTSQVEAQGFQWKAPLEPIYSNGYFKIFLPPSATGHMQSDFSDVRLYDNKGNEVAYFFYNAREISHSETRNFLEVQKVSRKLRKGYTRVLIKNEDRVSLNNICFHTQAKIDEAWIKVSGSNDLKKWVIIMDNTPYLSQETTQRDMQEIKITNLPPSEYAYYELRIYDHEKIAIKPDKVFYYDMKIKNVDYARIPDPEIEQRETQGGSLSIVNITFQQLHYIDKIEFEIDGPQYFLRKAALNNSIPIAEKKFNMEYYEQMNKKFELSSEQNNVLNLTNYKARKLELIIENKDSKPVTISNVKAFQVKKYLIARLKQNERYTVYFGNEEVDNPVYDLKYFRDSIRGDLPVAEIKHIMSLRKDEQVGQPKFDISPFYLWMGIALFLLFMIYISLRILTDLQREKDASENSGHDK